jgi:hypothetical protein
MRNHRPLGPTPGIIRKEVTTHSGKTAYLTLAILLTVLLFGSAPGAWATGVLTLSPDSLAFGSVSVGQTGTKTISVKNTGTSGVRIWGDTLVGAGYRVSGISFPTTLNVGESVTFQVLFTPSTAGSVSGELELFSDSRDRKLTVALSGEGGGSSAGYVTATPLDAQFGDVAVGTQNTESVTLKNTGGESLSVSSVTTSTKGFAISGITTPMSLAAGAETHFTLAFLPEAAGSVSGSVVVKSTGSDSSVSIAVSGTGVASSRVLSVSPASLSFGNVDVGSSTTQEITLKNTGNSSIAISSESVTGTGLSETGMGGAVTLGAGQSATMTVEFAPKSAGSVSGAITIASNASNGTSMTVPVTGDGVTTSSSDVVNLSWQASPSSGVVGYYVYRGSTSGGPYTKLVSSPMAGTSYKDSSVTAGSQYYYVVAAVNSDGSQSTYSNQAVVSVP